MPALLRAHEIGTRVSAIGFDWPAATDIVRKMEEEVAEIGPGAIVGERALLEGGTRTATLTARTRCRVAVIPGELIDRQELEGLSATRRA